MRPVMRLRHPNQLALAAPGAALSRIQTFGAFSPSRRRIARAAALAGVQVPSLAGYRTARFGAITRASGARRPNLLALRG